MSNPRAKPSEPAILPEPVGPALVSAWLLSSYQAPRHGLLTRLETEVPNGERLQAKDIAQRPQTLLRGHMCGKHRTKQSRGSLSSSEDCPLSYLSEGWGFRLTRHAHSPSPSGLLDGCVQKTLRLCLG